MGPPRRSRIFESQTCEVPVKPGPPGRAPGGSDSRRFYVPYREVFRRPRGAFVPGADNAVGLIDMLLCDFHIHTTYSDGIVPMRRVVDLFGQSGHDVIAITDHIVNRD